MRVIKRNVSLKINFFAWGRISSLFSQARIFRPSSSVACDGPSNHKSFCFGPRRTSWRTQIKCPNSCHLLLPQAVLTHKSTHQSANLLLCIRSNRGSCLSGWTTVSSMSSLCHLRRKPHSIGVQTGEVTCFWPAADLSSTCHIWFWSLALCIISLNHRLLTPSSNQS